MMTEVENKGAQQNGEETISTRSRYCMKCDAKFKFQCGCPNNSAMSWQMKNVFHSGKRYKGKDAWEKVHSDEIE
jgi:hypothetical protein